MRARRHVTPVAIALCAVAASMTVPVHAAHAQGAASLRGAGRVVGVVFDSTQSKPLAGALVQMIVEGDPLRNLSIRADSLGAFSFDSVAAGTYIAGFLDRRLDSLFITSPLQRVIVGPGGETRVSLFVPGLERIRSAFCGGNVARPINESSEPPGSAVFLGQLRQAADKRTTTGVVRVAWSEYLIGGKSIAVESPSVTVRTGDDGMFAVCGLPSDSRVSVQGFADTRDAAGAPVARDSSGVVQLPISDRGILLRDLYVGQGTGSVSGTVTTAEGRAVTGALVNVRTGTSQALTNARGTFTLADIPVGTQSIDVRRIGYEPIRVAVDVTLNPQPVTVTLRSLANFLATVNVIADRTLAGFYARRERRKLGTFLDEDLISRRNPGYVADIVRSTPGVFVKPSGSFSDRITLGIGRSECAPSVIIDGRYIPMNSADLDGYLAAENVRAVEVYRRYLDIPPQFNAPSGCGALVFWRGQRQPLPPR